MGNPDIFVEKAELVSVLLEAILYGFSFLMFGGTIWALVSQRSTERVNRKMFAVASVLLLLSTAHIVLSIIRIIQGLILYRDTYPGGPNAFFLDTSQWTFISKSLVFTAQTLIGDGVALYRCYVAWQSKLVMFLPALLWCAVAVTGIGSPYTALRVGKNDVFSSTLAKWITSFYAMTFTTNMLTTVLLAYRIWYIDQKATGLHGTRKSRLRPILCIIIDAGIIYSLTLLMQMICFSLQSNAQYMILDMITPIISITFYMVIIRVGVTNWTNNWKSNKTRSRYLSTLNAIQDRGTSPGYKVENHGALPLTPDTTVIANENVVYGIDTDFTEPEV